MNWKRVAILLVVLAVAGTGRAQDCLSDIRQVSQRGFFPNRSAGPVAWSGSVLAVAKTDSEPSKAIYLATYDASLHQVTADRLAAAASQNGPIALLWGGNEFALFYRTPSLQLTMRRFSAGGELIGDPIPVGNTTQNFPLQDFEIAFDPHRNAYVVARNIPQGVETGLWLTIVGTDGAVRYNERISFFIADPPDLKMAVGGNGMLAFVYRRPDDNNAFHFFRVDGSNNFQLSTRLSTAGRNLRIASNGSEFVVIEQAAATGGTELRWIRIANNGTVIGSETRFLAARGVDIAPVQLLWNPNGSEWALAYSDSVIGFDLFPGEFRLRRFTTTGAVISDTHFSPEPNQSTVGGRFPFVWTGSSYITAVDRVFSRVEGSDSYLIRNCPLAASIGVDRLAVLLHTPIVFDARVTGGTPDYVYSWDFGDLSEKRPERTIGHSYSRPGTYTVTLAVTDAAGATALVTRQVYVVEGRIRSSGKRR